MYRSTKHKTTSQLELVPPIKGMNNVDTPDLLDTLTAQKIYGAIEDNKIVHEYKFLNISSFAGYRKLFDFIIDNVKRVFTYTSSGISEVISRTSTNQIISIPGLSLKASTIPWDNKLLTLSNGKFYLDNKKQEIIQNFGQTIIDLSQITVINGIPAIYIKYKDEKIIGSNIGIFKVSNANLIEKLPNASNLEINYSKLFIYQDRLYRLYTNKRIDSIGLDGTTVKLFENEGEFLTVTSNVYVIDNFVYYGVIKLGAYEIWRVNMSTNTISKYFETNQGPFIGVYKDINQELIFVSFKKDDYKKIVKQKASGQVMSTIDLPFTAYNMSSTVGFGLVIFNNIKYMYFQDVNKSPKIAYLFDIDSKKYEMLNFLPNSMITLKDEILAISNTSIAQKTFVYINDGILIVKDGRVGVLSDNQLIFSAIGEFNNFTYDKESDALFIDIGYKEGGNYIDVVNGYDLIVFKSNGKIYRLANSYPDWVVNTIANIEPLISNVKQGGSSILFGTNTGVKEVNTSNIYGDYLVNNLKASIDLSKCSFIYFSNIRQAILFVLPDGIYEYNTEIGSYTKISDFVPKMISETDSDIFALGNDGKIYYMVPKDTVYYKYGRVISGNRFLINSVIVNATGTGSIDIKIGKKTYKFACDSENEKKYKERQIVTTDIMEPEVTITGSCELNKIIIEYSVIGG